MLFGRFVFFVVASCEAALFIQTEKNVQALVSTIWNRGSWREQPVTDEIRRLIKDCLINVDSAVAAGLFFLLR